MTVSDQERKELFNALVRDCSPEVQQVLSFLRTAALNAGPNVEAETYEANGGGVTYWTSGTRFCRFDPKPAVSHVWAMVPGADRSRLATAGEVSVREDGPWMTVSTMRGAVRLVPVILQKHDELSLGRGR